MTGGAGMTLRMRCLFVLALSVAMAGLLSAPSWAIGRSESEFVYTDSATIGEAQDILKHMDLLKGSYRHGSMDEATTGAIRQFQHEHGLASTGQLDRDTLAEIPQHHAATQRASDAGAPCQDR